MISMVIAAFAGAIMKLLGEQLPAYLVAWFRFLGMSLLLLPYLIWRFGIPGLMPARPWDAGRPRPDDGRRHNTFRSWLPHCRLCGRNRDSLRVSVSAGHHGRSVS